MSEYLKFFSLGSLWILLFAYFMRNGSTHLMAGFNWLRGKAMGYAHELYSIHCEVRHLRKLQNFRRWFNRHPGIRSARNVTFLLLLLLIAVPSFASQAAIFITQAGAGGDTGVDCANAHSFAWFNNAANWGAGSTQVGTTTNDSIVHICTGTQTSSSGAQALAFQGSGSSSSHVITLIFDSGAIMAAPYFAASTGSSACGGAICLNSKSFLVLDGGTNGIVQNTANGNARANQQATLGVDMFDCSTCTIQNLTIKDLYVRTSSADLATNPDVVNCIRITGSHNKILSNTFQEVGWCVMSDYGNGDTDFEIARNSWLHQAHGIMIASNSSFTITDIAIHDNWFKGSGTVWDGSGCPYHQSALHMFGGAAATTVADNLRIYNNRFDGDWGACPTGLIFQETGTGPIRVRDQYFYNNVAILSSTTSFENTNGWFNLSFITGFTLRVVNNTFIGQNVADNGVPWVFNSAATPGAIVFENNMTQDVGNPIYVQAAPSSLTSDYNIYDCLGFNCYVSPGPTFQNNLANWRTWCATLAAHPACDANSVQNSSPGISSDGSLTVGSAAISAATNLSSLATGSNTALQNDTTYGNQRTALARPGGSTAWDIGAYQYAAAVQTYTGRPMAFFFAILMAMLLLPILKDQSPATKSAITEREKVEWR